MVPHNAVLFLWITLIFNFSAQSQSRDAVIKEVDSLNCHYHDEDANKTFENTYARLKKCQSVNYVEGLLNTYNDLMWNYGRQQNLDSVLYYSSKFESTEKMYPNKKLRITYLMDKGNVFLYFLGHNNEGLDIYSEAYKLVADENENEDELTKSKIRANLAVGYIQKGQYDKGITMLKQSLNDSASIGERYKHVQLSHLALAYQYKKKPDKSTPILHKMLAYGEKHQDIQMKLYSIHLLAHDYFLIGNYQKAIDSGLAVRKKLIANQFNRFIAANSEYLADSYNAIGDTKNAIYYLEDAINTTDNLADIPKYYKSLGELYKNRGSLMSAIQSYEKRESIIDSLRALEKKKFTGLYDTKIKYINQTQETQRVLLEKDILAEKNGRQKLYIISLSVGLSCLLMIIVSFLIYKKYHKSKKTVVALKQKEKEVLKNHIKVREDELSAILIAQTKSMEELTAIEHNLCSAIRHNDANDITAAKESLSLYIASQGSYDIFSDRIGSQYPGIVHQLKKEHPKLSTNEIKHCILLKLRLSLKESAQLLNVSISTVKMTRNRAKAKMNLPEELSLKEYLDQIVSEEVMA